MVTALYSGQLSSLRHFFAEGNTRSADFRKDQLKKLRKGILDNEHAIYSALASDLKKTPEESWVTELGLVLSEIREAIKHLDEWMAPERVSTNLLNLPSSSRILREPLGVVLIISPWNYPFQLLINPLVGALAAGNCAVLKPSEYAPATAAIMKKIIQENFPPDYILFAEGDGATIIPAMMDNFRFDHIFYTGSTSIGRIIYKAAAEKLVPVTLELGGKSPCVVERDANIRVAARRIAVTKFSNAGQMCVAPDYVLVHASVKDELVKELKTAVAKFYGQDAAASYGYGRMINEKQFDRVVSYLSQGKILYGGNHKRDDLFIEPTIIEPTSPGAAVMNDEIFGPVLPIVSFEEFDEARQFVLRHPDPLALYVFTSSAKKEKQWLDSVPFGGGCVNNASWHLTNHKLPFGGRGFSGSGNYHGKYSFETFSHKKAILKTPTWFDPAMRYPPFKGKLGLFKKIIG